jgi:RNA polymerase sigma-70 factor (ECF subfamily)
MIFRMVQDYDYAEELTQTVFVKVYQNLNKYNTKYKFYSWIYRIAVNETLNFIKRNQKAQPLADEWETIEKGPADKIGDEEISHIIAQVLSELKPEYRIIVVMRHFLDYSYQQIGEVLQIPEKKVKSRLYSARQLLGDLLVARGITKYE